MYQIGLSFTSAEVSRVPKSSEWSYSITGLKFYANSELSSYKSVFLTSEPQLEGSFTESSIRCKTHNLNFKFNQDSIGCLA